MCVAPDKAITEWFSSADSTPSAADSQLDRATLKSRTELKTLAKKNDVKSARILAKEIVRANKQRDRLHSTKARINSVDMQLQHQLGRLLLGDHCRSEADASHGQGDGGVPEVDRDHEDYEPARQAAAAERDDAGNEHGDDEGASRRERADTSRGSWKR